jgi:hypothetical protein
VKQFTEYMEKSRHGFMETRIYHIKDPPEKFWWLSLTYNFRNIYETVSGIHGTSFIDLCKSGFLRVCMAENRNPPHTHHILTSSVKQCMYYIEEFIYGHI